MPRDERHYTAGTQQRRRLARPRQIDLFAQDPGKTAPRWPELPERRAILTDLMARLILEHAATARPAEGGRP